jgi:uncharacterized protein YeaO (DUF488 family)
VPKAEFASRDYYDCWYPELSPSAGTMALGQAAQSGEASLAAVRKAFRKQLAEPAPIAHWACSRRRTASFALAAGDDEAHATQHLARAAAKALPSPQTDPKAKAHPAIAQAATPPASTTEPTAFQ